MLHVAIVWITCTCRAYIVMIGTTAWYRKRQEDRGVRGIVRENEIQRKNDRERETSLKRAKLRKSEYQRKRGN